MSEIETITPSQIIEAIRYAKKTNPEDKFGDGAFKINHETKRPGKQGVKYMPFEVLKKRPNGKWEFIPLEIEFMNLVTKSRILPPNSDKRKFPGVQLQFAGSSKYFNPKKDQNGNVIYVEEPYGTAKILATKAYNRKMIALLKDKKKPIKNSSSKISLPIQFERNNAADTDNKLKLDDPIIRVTVPFKNPKGNESEDKINKNKPREIMPDDIPRCDIYDATKKIDKADPKYKPNDFNFELATVEKDGVKFSITYENIGEFILPGSSVSGIDSMSTISLSSMGISLASKTTLLIVKPSKGYKPLPNKIFNSLQIDTFDKAETSYVDEYNEDENKENIENEEDAQNINDPTLDEKKSDNEENKEEEEDLEDQFGLEDD